MEDVFWVSILCKQSAEMGRAKKRSWQYGLDEKIPVVRGPLKGKLWKVIVGMKFILFWCFGREHAILAQTLFLIAVSCSSPEAGAMTADTDDGGQHDHLMMIPMWQIEKKKNNNFAAFVKLLDCWSYCIETLVSWSSTSRFLMLPHLILAFVLLTEMYKTVHLCQNSNGAVCAE